MNNYTKYLELEQKLIEMEKMLETMDNQNKCGNCGALIADWDDVEFTGTEVILTHKCACGRYAEVHNRVVYDRTEVIEEGEQL
jgi:hypothetical protein